MSKQKNVGLSWYDLEDGDFTSIIPLLREARNSNMWIYSKNTFLWYTPDEFEVKYGKGEYNNHETAKMLNGIVIRNPIVGIRAFHKQLDMELDAIHQRTVELRLKAEEFNKKVIEYYQLKPKR